MTTRSVLKWVVMAVAGTIGITVGVLLPSAAVLVPAVLGASLAYDGPDRRGVLWTSVFLTLLELFLALDLGSLSLSYLAAAGVLSLVGRLVAIGPWASTDGWPVADALRAYLVAVFLALIIMAGFVLVGLLYGNGHLTERAGVEFTPHRLAAVAIACVFALLVLRRIDAPLRPPIRFGT